MVSEAFEDLGGTRPYTKEEAARHGRVASGAGREAVLGFRAAADEVFKDRLKQQGFTPAQVEEKYAEYRTQQQAKRAANDQRIGRHW